MTRQSIETEDLRVCGSRSPGQARGLHSNAFCVLACFVSLSFAGLVVLARSLNPIPSRTRPLNSSAPMVLWLKPWESRSLPGLPRTRNSSLRVTNTKTPPPSGGGVFVCLDEWRQAPGSAGLFEVFDAGARGRRLSLTSDKRRNCPPPAKWRPPHEAFHPASA